MAEQLIDIPIEQIQPNPYQPRLEFSEEELEELGQSIKKNGLIQPLIVRKSQVWGYELIAGERRLRASKLIGLDKVPAVVKDIDDQLSMQQAIIENLQRSDLNPIEEALAYQKLIEKTEMTHDEIAQTIGKSRPYITNSLRLLNLPERGKEALIEGKISSGHARLILSLPEEEQVFWIEKCSQKDISVRQLEINLKEKKSNQPKSADHFVRYQEEELKKQLGREVTIKINQQAKGQLIIPFQSLEDFHKLLNILGVTVEND